MELKRLKIGEFVISRAGRDKGKLLIVVERVDDTFVRVVDGDLRRMNHPKLKKIMHLNLVNYKDDALAVALESGESITDHSIRKSIEHYRNVTKPPRRE
jgi:ribosomal protein L14E/L6E/L27E